jgi:hypothetical protein
MVWRGTKTVSFRAMWASDLFVRTGLAAGLLLYCAQNLMAADHTNTVSFSVSLARKAIFD